LRSPGSEPPTKSAGYFSVFIDRAPIKPGRSLRSVGDTDRACVHDPSCPDAQYLADRQVYSATEPLLKLTEVQPLETKDGVQLHGAIVVLMDTAGRRIGEAAWRLEFRVRKRTFG
jgi:hypothetical protein